MLFVLNYETEILNIRTRSVNVVPTKSTKLETPTISTHPSNKI